MDLSLIGFTLIESYYSNTNEVFCIIAKEDATKRLVVAFRGTASKKQMNGNLNYQRIHLNLFTLHTRDVDELDGLSVGVDDVSDDEDDEVQFLSDDEEGYVTEDEDSEKEEDEKHEEKDEEKGYAHTGTRNNVGDDGAKVYSPNSINFGGEKAR